MNYFKKFIAIIFVFSASSASALPPMPTTGNCAFLMSNPIPYGLADVNSYGETGFNFLGTLTFNSSTSASFSAHVVNVKYRTSGTPSLGPSAIVTNAPVSITPMTSSNGFIGGYILSVKLTSASVKSASPMNGTQIMNINAVPVNSGNSVLLQFSDGAEPGAGVCQF